MQIIVLEDTKEYISYAPKEEIKAQDRRPFDLLVCSYTEKRRVLKVSLQFCVWYFNTSFISSLEAGDRESKAREEEQKDCPIF